MILAPNLFLPKDLHSALDVKSSSSFIPKMWIILKGYSLFSAKSLMNCFHTEGFLVKKRMKETGLNFHPTPAALHLPKQVHPRVIILPEGT